MSFKQGSKGAIQGGHMPKNAFKLVVPTLVPVQFVEVSEFKLQTEKVELPNRSIASTGKVRPVTFSAKQMAHHRGEVFGLELWRQEAIDPITLTYKKAGALSRLSINGFEITTATSTPPPEKTGDLPQINFNNLSVVLFTGLWITDRKDPDMDMANPGDPVMIEWFFSADIAEGA